MAQRLRVAAVGEIVEDVVLPEGRRALGGISANFARSAAAAGADVTLYAPVGDDERGRRLRSSLVAAGLSDACVRTLPGASAEQRLTLAPDGERVFCGFAAGVLTAYELTGDEATEIAASDVLAVPCSPESQRVFRQCLELGEGSSPRRVADFSQDSPIGEPSRPDDWLRPYLARLAVAFVGGPAAFLSPLLALSRGTTTPIVITAGAAGAWALAGGKAVHQPTLATEVVNTTGCGDAFQAAFCVALFSGASLTAALEAGAVRAAAVAARRG